MLAQSPKGAPPPTPYLTILNTYLKPKLLTRLEKRVKRKTVVELKELSQQIQETKCRRERLLTDSRQLLEEKYRVQAENQLFTEYLRKNKEQCEKKQEELWKQYIQECGEIERERQELASRYNQRNAALQAQLLQGRKTQKDLKQQLQALKPIYKVKEGQDMKIQSLEQEQEKVRGETAAKDQKAHFRFLQEKALMEKELEDLHLMELGQINTTGLTRKYKALALAAKQAHSEFCGSLHRENQQLRKELQQLSQEYRRVEAVRNQLEKHRRLMKEQRWYLEALTRGRQRLQAERERHHRRHNPCLKEQRTSKTMLSTKSKTSLK
ncbi:coiled-coil domain containing 121, retrotransposed [Rattus norvegicus]|uniref:Coiled-coil domain containing 121, retrogene 1 n=1 Tax=Rattus norvegicus TaxID=10116 RepID=F1LTT6_RAT|nr:coiled-coil domain containing 121, retrotransposed [Rattus norvegicus]|eukprot:XP_223007.4 PREDICTED: coiled-coil domain-containing protein 121-like [Rattus norvegicus]